MDPQLFSEILFECNLTEDESKISEILQNENSNASQVLNENNSNSIPNTDFSGDALINLMNKILSLCPYIGPAVHNPNPVELVLKTTLYGVLFLLGTMGNLCVMVHIICAERAHSATDKYVLNLVFCDMAVLFLCTWQHWAVVNGAGVLEHTGYPFGWLPCKISSAVQGMPTPEIFCIQVLIYTSVYTSVCRQVFLIFCPIGQKYFWVSKFVTTADV